MDNRLPVLLLCVAALALAAVVYYLIYRSKNTRE